MLDLFQPVLAADFGPIIQAIIFLVILASGVVKMFRESKEAQQRAERQRQMQPPPPAPGDEDLLPRRDEAPAGGVRKPGQETIRSEVEEFLRRVGQQVEGDRPPRPQQQPPKRRQPSRIEVLDDGSGFDVAERPRQSHRKRQPSSKPQEPRRLQPTSTIAEPLRPVSEGLERGETVAQHVAQHLNQTEFVRRAAQLGEDLAQTDERLEARLHEKFDHGLGSLAARRQAREAADLAEAGVAASPTAAQNLLDILATPQGVQQAIILSEVLNRPADRW